MFVGPCSGEVGNGSMAGVEAHWRSVLLSKDGPLPSKISMRNLYAELYIPRTVTVTPGLANTPCAAALQHALTSHHWLFSLPPPSPLYNVPQC